MNLRTIVWNTALAATTAISLQAHPGHEPFSEGARHFFASPSHTIPALILSVALLGAAQFMKHRGQRVTLRASAAVIAIVAFIA